MFELQPETSRMLGIILREMEQTIIPDLHTEHAQRVAYMIAHSLRSLSVREVGLPAILEEWNQIEAGLLETVAPQSCDAQNPWHRNHVLSDALETVVVQHIGAASGGELDEVCRRVIAAERDHFAARGRLIGEVAIPQRTGQQRDLLAVTPERLTRYLRKKWPQYGSLEVRDIKPIISGFSKETFLVDLVAAEKPFPVVLRRNIPRSPVVNSSVVDEYPIVMALFRAGFPVPEPLLVEADNSAFGEAFTITRRMSGIVAATQFGGVGGVPEMVTAAREFAAFLARLHSADLNDFGLPHTVFQPELTTRDYLEREIDIYEGYYRDHRLQPSPTISAALTWLRVNVPNIEDPPRLVHGDAWLSNVLMDDGRLSAVLDWELARPGDANYDLAYGRKWMEQVMPWEEFLAVYYANGGPEYHPEREKFHSMFMKLKTTLYTARATDILRTTEHPEIAHLYAANHYYGHFLCELADELL